MSIIFRLWIINQVIVSLFCHKYVILVYCCQAISIDLVNQPLSMGETTNASPMHRKTTFQGKEGIWTLSVITLACNLPKGAYLAKEAVAKSIHGVGFPPLTDLIEKVVNVNFPVYV